MTKIFAFMLACLACITSGFAAGTTGQQLANYLGTGSNPRLVLTLSANGPNWGAFTIDYQGIGNVPWIANPSNNWSSWNVYDTATPQNYYGTITLTSDGTTVAWSNYVAGTGGYYLDGINLSYNNNINAFQLTVEAIYPSGGGGSGPFPDAPAATPMVYPGTSQPIILSVAGDQIVNDKGDPIILKGLVRPSLEWSATGQYMSTQDLSEIANWKSGGAQANSNVIRLDLYQGFWLNSGPATQIGSYKQIINAIVYYATQLGMAVILDLHWTTSGYQTQMANQDSITFWQQVAADYKDFGTVLFELYNEPFGITQDVWLNGDATYAGYQELYNAVRGAGAQNICIVGGLDYAYDLSFVSPSFKVAGTNIVYCSHPYNQKGQPGYTGEGGTFQQNYQGVLGNFPLIFTEFGVNSAAYFPTGYEPIYQNTLQYINANKISYTGFAWWVQAGQPQFPALISDWDGDAQYGGVDVHTDMINSPGTPLPGGASELVSFQSLVRTAGNPTHFDGSDTSADTYCWYYGDGTSECSQTGLTSHVYALPGSYVVVLTTTQGGSVIRNSKTIKVESKPSGMCVLVCPPRDVQGRQTVAGRSQFKNTITWRGPKASTLCEKPDYYLVYKGKDLKHLVGRVSAAQKEKSYKIVDVVKHAGRTTYGVVAVDSNGNHSLPVTISLGKKGMGHLDLKAKPEPCQCFK